VFKASHKMIADRLHALISVHQDIHIHYRDFLYGSIKPDLSPQIFLSPHSIQNMESHGLYQKIDTLRRQFATRPVSASDQADSAVVLGEIVHFICDYFCLPHSGPLKRMGVLRHNVYERRLGRYIRRKPFPILDSFVQGIGNHDLFNDKDSFTAWLNAEIENYHALPHSFYKDVYFAVSISLTVIGYIFRIAIPFPTAFLPNRLTA